MLLISFSYFHTPFKEIKSGQKARQDHAVFSVGEIIMANNENLLKGKATQFKTGEEQVEIARRGGIASGKAKREKKLIKDRILERMGEGDWDTMIDNLISRAMETDKAFEILRDTVGQKPSEKVDLSIEDESAREIDEYFAEKYNKSSGK